jgi:hypothetical protein
MSVNRLTDGMPLTTEWLNSLADAINNLSSSVETLGEPQKEIAFNGTPIGNSAVQVLVGTWTGVASAGAKTVEGTIKFSTSFKDNNVSIVGNTTFASAGERKPRPFKSALSFADISSTGCEFTISLVEDDMDFNAGKVTTINYIAIGKKR